MLFGYWPLFAILVACKREPAWHRRARRSRSIARSKLSAVSQAQRIPLKQVTKYVNLLDSHHGSTAPRKVKAILIAAAAKDMSQIWWCRFCEVRMGITSTHCNHCNRHWKQAQYDPTKERAKSQSREKKRSKSRSASNMTTPRQGREQSKEETALQMFTEKTPWVATTPKTRMEVEPAGEEILQTDSTADSTAGKTLTEQQEKYKQQLLDLKQCRGSLPADLEKELQELLPAVQMPILTHKHLNLLSKLEKTVSAIYKKITEMDSQWQIFVAQANEKFNKHKSLYVQSRDQLLQDLREKNGELNRLKAEITAASEGLQPQVLEDEIEQVPPEALASMMNQQHFKVEQMEPLGPCPYPLVEGVVDVDTEMEMLSAESAANEADTKRRPVGPFRLGASPTKVQQHSLKDAQKEIRRGKQDKAKEKSDKGED